LVGLGEYSSTGYLAGPGYPPDAGGYPKGA